MPGGASGEKRTRTACLDSGQISRLETRSGVSNPENPAMNGYEPTVRESCPDLPLRDPCRQKFLAADDTVGPGRQRCEFPADRGVLWSHIDH